MRYQNPFPLSDHVHPTLQAVLEHWRALKRGENKIPFSDDVDLSSLRASRILLLEVFERPQRFRLVSLTDLTDATGDSLKGKFLDEIPTHGLLSYLAAQSSATVECAEPTFCQLVAADSGPDFSRILLPAWGDGHVNTLLCAIAVE